MSAMEQSLRRALDAGDARDPAFRESIYAASERALERMLSERPMAEEAAQAQRIRLAETINRVEQDYYAADAGDLPAEDAGEWDATDAAHAPLPDAPQADGLSSTMPDDPAREGYDSAPIEGRERFRPSETDPETARQRPVVDPEAPSFLRRSSDPAASRVASSGASRTPRQTLSSGFGGGGRPPAGRFRQIFVVVVALAFLILAYLVYGMIYGPTTSEPTGAETSDAGEAGEERGWIALFDGTQLGSIATPAGGRVQTITGADERPALRMSSAGEGGEIEVAVGPGVARELAGETVRVEVTVGSPDGEPREFGVRCLFSGQTVCGTHRFRTALASEAFVFEMAVPRGARNAGSIAFEPGYGEGGRPLDLYGVRARIRDAA